MRVICLLCLCSIWPDIRQAAHFRRLTTAAHRSRLGSGCSQASNQRSEKTSLLYEAPNLDAFLPPAVCFRVRMCTCMFGFLLLNYYRRLPAPKYLFAVSRPRTRTKLPLYEYSFSHSGSNDRRSLSGANLREQAMGIGLVVRSAKKGPWLTNTSCSLKT